MIGLQKLQTIQSLRYSYKSESSSRLNSIPIVEESENLNEDI